MKKKIVSIIIMVFIAILIYSIGYITHFLIKPQNKNNDEHNISKDDYVISENEIAQIIGYPSIHIYYDDVLGKIDYPLIDIYFDENNDWVIIKSDISTNNHEFYIIKNASSVELAKAKISVLSFPIGRGTTANGYIYILKDDILIKEIPYIELYISDDYLNNLFEKISEEEFKDFFK